MFQERGDLNFMCSLILSEEKMAICFITSPARLWAYEPLFVQVWMHWNNCTTVGLTVNKLLQSTQLPLVSHHKRSLVLFTSMLHQLHLVSV